MLVTHRLGLKERDFDIDVENPRIEDFQRVIQSRGWQLFCKHPKVASIAVVYEFYANIMENTSSQVVFMRGK